MRNFIKIGAAAAVFAGAAFIAAPAVAGPSALLGKWTGGVGFQHTDNGVTSVRYMDFSAFDYGATGDKGSVTYTNFTVPVALATYPVHTGVWNLPVNTNIPLVLDFGAPYAHTMVIGSEVATSPSSLKFAGTGSYDADSSYTWDVKGSISGTTVTFLITYTGTDAGYWFSGTGTINSDGSVTSITSLDPTVNVDRNGLHASWSMPAGSAFEVWSFTAAVTAANYTAGTFTFNNPLNGIPADAVVTDTATPALGTPVPDKLALDGLDQFITGGNIVQH